ncbi:MAG: thiosulfate sulfurtransferase GlpE [Pseudomonadales bacterium]|nr:thiosulfate sulfurtransferase GlpE [Pseudomonadales bacterium]
MSFKRIDVPALVQMRAKQQVIIADIRDDASFETGHIDGSIQLGNHNLPDFMQSCSETDPIIVVCYHGISSQPVAGFLVEQGYSDVYSLDGGYTGWAAAHTNP